MLWGLNKNSASLWVKLIFKILSCCTSVIILFTPRQNEGDTDNNCIAEGLRRPQRLWFELWTTFLHSTAQSIEIGSKSNFIFIYFFSYSDFQAYCRSKKNKTFICKPESGCQGKGIFLTKNPKDIKPGEHIICQQYLNKVGCCVIW